MPFANGRPPVTRRRIATAAVCQPLAANPFKDAYLCRRFLEMEWLRVRLGGELFHPRCFYGVASRSESLADVQILEIQLLDFLGHDVATSLSR